MKRNSLIGLNEQELMQVAELLGEKSFRGRQLYHQIYGRKELDLERMTDLPKEFRTRMGETCDLRAPEIVHRDPSADGSIKFLFTLSDGKHIESVFIPEEQRQTLCISSQVGCGVGCTFCMTAQMGFYRNLTAGEIVGQVLVLVREGWVRQQGLNIVFMGMGEPLYNYRNVMKAFRIMTDSKGMGLSHRKITLSTSGVVPVLEKMCSETNLPNLAISLNATTNDLRNELMPINRKWDLEELLNVCRRFPTESRRRITFEYVLLAGVTDSTKDAHRLVGLMREMRAKVNLIPYNPNPGLPYERPTRDRIRMFQEILVNHSVPAFVRKTRGEDVAAACGQLAYLQKS